MIFTKIKRFFLHGPQDEITSTFANRYDEYGVADVNYIGSYLLTNKNSDAWYSNALVIVYSATISSKESEFNPVTVYLPVEFDNLMVGGSDSNASYSGTVEGYSNVDTTDGYTASVPGYTDGAEMYKDLISSNVDDYNYEMSDGLKQFGN